MSDDRSLPILLRQSIRDVYEDLASGVQQRIDSVESELGQRIVVDPQWHVLSKAKAFAEARELPPVVVRSVNALLDTIIEALADADAEERFENIIEKLKGKAALKIILNVATDDLERFPHATWLEREAQVLLAIPQTTEATHPSRIEKVLADDLRAILLGGRPQRATPPIKGLGVQAAEDGSWDIVGESPERLPRDDEIDMPEALLSKPPYYLSVEAMGNSIVVMASHENSLLLLEAYLKRWTKRSNVLPPPNNNMVKLSLRESPFGSSTPVYDVLEIKAERESFLSPTLVLSFVRTVLKYEPREAAGYGVRGWSFVRDRPFA